MCHIVKPLEARHLSTIPYTRCQPMKQFRTAFCFALALITHTPSWAAAPIEQRPNDKLLVSGALYRDDYMVMSFADIIDNGQTLRAQAQVTSSCVSKVSSTGDKELLTPATYQHGYDLNVTPIVQPDGAVTLSYWLHSDQVLGFLNPAKDVKATGAPQFKQLDFETTAPRRTQFGREEVTEFSCDQVMTVDGKQPLKQVNCRYHLVVTVNKAPGR